MRPRPLPHRLPLAAALALSGCLHHFQVPSPPAHPVAPPPEVELSTIDLPISVDLGPVFDEVERQIPASVDSTRDWTSVANDRAGVKFRVTRQPFELALNGNLLRAQVRAGYALDACVRIPRPWPLSGAFCPSVGTCGMSEAPRQVLVSMATELQFTDDWRVQSSTQIAPPNFLDRCTISVLDIDVTDQVSAWMNARLSDASHLIDGRITERANLRPQAERAWQALSQPVELADDVWLVLDPESVHVAPLAGTGRALSTAVGITARPHVVVGHAPTPAPRPLPRLESSLPGAGFHIALAGQLPYTEATAILSARFAGRSFDVSGHSVHVTRVRVSGRPGLAIFEIGVRFRRNWFGDAEGTLYLTGRPRYDVLTGVLGVEDLQFTAETASVVLNLADWLLHDDLKNAIVRNAQWALAERIQSVRDAADRALHRSLGPGMDLTGSIAALRPLGVYTTDDGFAVQVIADGSARLDVRWTP